MFIIIFLYDLAFTIAFAVSAHLVMLRMRRNDLNVVHVGTLFNTFRVMKKRDKSHANETDEPVVDEKRSALASIAVLVAVTVISFQIDKFVTGEQIGIFLVCVFGTRITYAVFKKSHRRYPYQSAIIACVVGSMFSYLWYTHDNWVMNDAVVFSVCLFAMITLVQPVPFKRLVLMCGVIVLYDLWGVWGQGFIVDSVKEMMKTRLPPMAFTVPRLPMTMESKPLSFTGLGDVVLPAFVTLTAAKYGLHRWMIGSYAIGFVVVVIIMFVVPSGVPAMVPILPLMVGTLYIVGKRKRIVFE